VFEQSTSSQAELVTLTQSCFSCLSASSLGWPSFQAVKSVLHVASLVPIVPPVNVKLVPSENVYVPSVALSSSPTQKSTESVFKVVSKLKMASDFGAASFPFSAKLAQASLAVE